MKVPKVYLKALLFTIFVPGTALVAIPYFLLTSGRGLVKIGMLKWLGLVPLLLGGIALLWCIWDFARIGRGTPAPIDPPKVMVERGLYRFVRNPMYVGALGVLLGEALVFQSLSVVGWAIFMGLLFHTFVVLYEEPTLRKKFGKSYEDYHQSVPRWVPRLRS